MWEKSFDCPTPMSVKTSCGALVGKFTLGAIRLSIRSYSKIFTSTFWALCRLAKLSNCLSRLSTGRVLSPISAENTAVPHRLSRGLRFRVAGREFCDAKLDSTCTLDLSLSGGLGPDRKTRMLSMYTCFYVRGVYSLRMPTMMTSPGTISAHHNKAEPPTSPGSRCSKVSLK